MHLISDVPANIATLYSDPEKLRQILLNLLGNAVKFTDHGEIRISASQENGNFKLTIADTGIGIDQADISRIFDEFDRGMLANDGDLLRHRFRIGDRCKAGHGLGWPCCR